MRRKILLIFLTIYGLLFFQSCSLAEELEEYQCGNYTYLVLENGSAKITKFESWMESPTTLTIPEELDGHPVMAIGDLTFSEWEYVKNTTTVILPESIISIGDNAFMYCGAMTTINIPAAVKYLGANPFAYCDSLTTIMVSSEHPDLIIVDDVLYSKADKRLICYPCGLPSKSFSIPKGVESIGKDAFAGSYLENIILPDSILSIEDAAFGFCNYITDITLPDSITYIGASPFWNCENLASIKVSANHPYLEVIDGVLYSKPDKKLVFYPMTLENPVFLVPEGIRIINAGAFANCSSITMITLPKSIISIERNAFQQCKNLTSINLPESISTIGKMAFNGCSSLSNITLPCNVTSIEKGTFSFCSLLQKIDIPDSVTSIGDDAFIYCNSLKEITLPKSVSSIGKKAFFLCDRLRAIRIGENIYAKRYCEENKLPYVYIDVKGLEKEMIVRTDSSNFNYVMLADGNVEIVGISSYSDIIVIPEKIGGSFVTSIGENGCSSSKARSIQLPDTITHIGSYAFKNCDLLTSINIPKDVVNMGENPFIGCSNLHTIELQPSNTNFDFINGCLIEKSSGKLISYLQNDRSSLVVPFGAKSIGTSSFSGVTGLTNIILPISVERINDSAFMNCVDLEQISFTPTLVYIGVNPFENCVSLKKIYIPEDNPALYMHSGALISRDNKSVICYIPGAGYELVIPDNIETIEERAFSGLCVKVCQLEGIRTIKDYAFQHAKITSLSLPSTLEYIGNYAFADCECDMFAFKGERIKEIGDYVFKNCKFLHDTIIIPASTVHIGINPFLGCSKLVNIEVDKNNESYADIEGVLYNKKEKELICYPTGKNGTAFAVPNGIKKINELSFDHCLVLTSIILPDTVEKICEGAFQNCTSVEFIDLGRGLKIVENGAFDYCSNLREIIFPEGMERIGSTFWGCYSLSKVTIPDTVVYMDIYALSIRDSLKKVIVYRNSMAESECIAYDIPYEYVDANDWLLNKRRAEKKVKSKVVFCFLLAFLVWLCECAAEELPSIDEALTYAIKENDYSRIEVQNTLSEYAVFNENNFHSKRDKVIVFERLDAEGLFTESKIDCFEPNYEEHRVGEPRLFVRNDLMLLLPPDMRATSMEEADYFIIGETYYDLDQEIVHTVYEDNGNEYLPNYLNDPEQLFLYLLQHPRNIKEYTYKPLYSVYTFISIYDAVTRGWIFMDYQYNTAPLQVNNPEADEKWYDMEQLWELISFLKERDSMYQNKDIYELVGKMDFLSEEINNRIKNCIEAGQYAELQGYLDSYYWKMALDLSEMDDSEEAKKWYPKIIEAKNENTLMEFVNFRNYDGIDTPDSTINKERLYIAEYDKEWIERELIKTLNQIANDNM